MHFLSVCTFRIFFSTLLISPFYLTASMLHWKPCQPYWYDEVERNMNVMFLLGTKTFLMVALALKISAWETLCFSSILDSQARRPSSWGSLWRKISKQEWSLHICYSSLWKHSFQQHRDDISVLLVMFGDRRLSKLYLRTYTYVYECSASTSQRTQFMSITKTNCLKLFMELIVAYYENYTQYMSTL
jgi:hypothetical protein